MKNIISFLLIMFTLVRLSAQGNIHPTVNYEQIVPTSKGKTMEDILVQLAWQNNPDNETLYEKVGIKEIELKKAKNAWKEDFVGQININQNNLAQVIYPNSNTVTLYPIWNVGVNFNLGKFLNRPHDVAIKNREITISNLDIDQKKLKIRSETLKRYSQYLTAVDVFKARTKAEEDASSKYILLTELFKENKVKIEDYNEASSQYHTAVESTIRSQGEVTTTRIALEEIIGVHLDAAEAYYRK